MYNFLPDNYFWTVRIAAAINESYPGGSNYGEIAQVIGKLKTEEPESWLLAWESMGNKVRGLAEDAEIEGRLKASQHRYLRASSYYQKAELFLKVNDPRRSDLYARSLECFHRGIMAMPSIEDVKIPYEKSYLPGYFLNASDHGERRPVLVINDGLDGTAEMMFFIFGRACLEYGLSALIVDGPGNGRALRLNGITARHDYEVPAKAIFEYLQNRADVDPKKIAFQAMSLGGYYAPRAVAFEKRYAACVVYGALFDYAEIWANRPDDYPLALHLMWILGVDSMAIAREKLRDWNLRQAAPLIECPTLILHGEADQQVPLNHAYRLYEALRCPKKLRVFKKEDGGDQHCQLDNLGNAREEILGWLTSTLSLTSP